MRVHGIVYLAWLIFAVAGIGAAIDGNWGRAGVAGGVAAAILGLEILVGYLAYDDES